MPRSRIAGSYGSSTLVFKKPAYCSPQCLYQFTFPPKVWEGSLLPTPSPAFIIFRLFDDAHPDWCEVIHHCSFDLHISNSDVEHLFMCFLGYLYVSEEMSVQIFCSFFDWVFCFFILSYMSSLHINPLSVASFENIFSHSVGYLFVLFMVPLMCKNFQL